MRMSRFALTAGFVISSALFYGVAANADEADQSTKITFSQPIEIPGKVLPAGTYLFKIGDIWDLDMIRIFNANGSRLYATLQTVPVERKDIPALTDRYRVVCSHMNSVVAVADRYRIGATGKHCVIVAIAEGDCVPALARGRRLLGDQPVVIAIAEGDRIAREGGFAEDGGRGGAADPHQLEIALDGAQL